MSDGHQYPEADGVQRPAIAWLRRNRGYQEVFEDAEAGGDRLDSVGLLDGRLILMEVKAKIDGSKLRFAESRSGTVEAKISGALHEVAEASENRLSRAILSQLPMASRPTVVLLAGYFTKGSVEEAADLFRKRAHDWEFDWAVWYWTGAQVRELAAGHGSGDGFPSADRIPRQNHVSPPRKKASFALLEEKATEHGVQEIFVLADKLLREAGFKRRPTSCSGQTYMLRRDGKDQTLVGLYLGSSSRQSGLNLGLAAEDPACSGVPEGLVKAQREGRLNTNRWVRSRDDVESVIRAFGRSG